MSWNYNVKEEKPKLIRITEAWTNADINNSELNISGYTLFRKDRVEGKGGGVLLYVDNTLDVIERKDLQVDGFEESLWCEICVGGEKTVIGVCYRSPSCTSDEDKCLIDCFKKACKSTSRMPLG